MLCRYVVVELARDVVTDPVISLVETVAAEIQTVTDSPGVDEFGHVDRDAVLELRRYEKMPLRAVAVGMIVVAGAC